MRALEGWGRADSAALHLAGEFQPPETLPRPILVQGK